MSEMFELIGVLLLRPVVANIDRLDQSSDKACRLVVSLPDLLFISVRLDLLYPKHLTFVLSNSLLYPSLSQLSDLAIPFFIFVYPKHLTLMLCNSPLYPIHLTFCFGHSNSLLLLPWFYFYQYFFGQAHNPKYSNLVNKARGHCFIVSMCDSI